MEEEIRVYEKHKNLKIAANELGVKWQSLYVRLKKAGIAVTGDKERYGSDKDRLANKAESIFQSLVPNAISQNDIKFQSNLLRSNCRVTNQPDWGDVFIHIKPKAGIVPDLESLARYIVSHRQVSHFHEEICEMVYMHLKEAYNPEELMVACLYTRRGGLDINPIRASHKELIPGFFTDINCRMAKTLRQ